MKRIVLIFVLILNFLALKAQNDSLKTMNDAQDYLDSNALIFSAKTFTPFGKSSMSNMVSNLSLTSTYKEGENGKIELKDTTGWWTYGISINKSIGKKDKEVVVMDLNGINSGTTFGFNLQKIFWNPVVSDAFFNKFQEAKKEYAKNHPEMDIKYIMLSDMIDDPKCMKIMGRDIRFKQPWFFNIDCSITKTEYDYVTDSINL